MKDSNNNENKEFIAKYFIWTELEEQKRKAIKLQNMTKSKEKRR